MKRTIKDSVFTNLFKNKKYLIQLYQALHPDDKKITENDIKDITINNILVNDIYNQEEVMRSYVRSKEHDTKVETAKRYLAMDKLSFKEIAIGSGLSIEEVEELAGLQLA